MAWRPELCTTFGAMHGGAMMAMADSVGAVCAFLNLPEGATTSTIESKTNFFRGLREGTLHATSTPLHVGRTTIVVQTDLLDDRGKHVARGHPDPGGDPARVGPSAGGRPFDETVAALEAVVADGGRRHR